jgi:predicted RNA-binding protein with PUA domain
MAEKVEKTEKKKAKQVWGKRVAEFYDELANKTILVATSNGKVFKGALVGVDVYDIIIRQDSGLELLLPKGNIVYVHQVGG